MNMKNAIILLLYAGFLSQLGGCTEFFEPDVSETRLVIHSPVDSLLTASSDLTFWWEGNDSAEAYRLQIAYPRFSRLEFLFDTLLTEESLRLNLDPGTYEWRLRIENPGSSSPYQRRIFTIDQFQPAVPFLTYPPRQDTLRFGGDSLELRWESQDSPIDGIQAQVSDSVYLNELKGGEVRQAYRFFVGPLAAKRIALRDIIPSPAMGELRAYEWQVVSMDVVGNVRRSRTQTFVIRP